MTDAERDERLIRLEMLLELHNKALQVMAGSQGRIERMIIEIRENTRRPGVDFSVYGKDQEP